MSETCRLRWSSTSHRATIFAPFRAWVAISPPPIPPAPIPATLTRSLGGTCPAPPSTWRGTIVNPKAIPPVAARKALRDVSPSVDACSLDFDIVASLLAVVANRRQLHGRAITSRRTGALVYRARRRSARSLHLTSTLECMVPRQRTRYAGRAKAGYTSAASLANQESCIHASHAHARGDCSHIVVCRPSCGRRLQSREI